MKLMAEENVKDQEPRGVWTSTTTLELLRAYVKFRPRRVVHGEQIQQREKVAEDNNKSSSGNSTPEMDEAARKAWRCDDKGAAAAHKSKRAQGLKDKEDAAKMLQKMSLEGEIHHSEKTKDKDKGNDSINNIRTMKTPVFTSPSPVIERRGDDFTGLL
ncbi:hypothetical protein BD408DRAFT_440017 [Parasitella parasitica]|nr:hypothetical protein BD408DRAFT_440017 [Parasitella parasitica]